MANTDKLYNSKAVRSLLSLLTTITVFKVHPFNMSMSKGIATSLKLLQNVCLTF